MSNSMAADSPKHGLTVVEAKAVEQYIDIGKPGNQERSKSERRRCNLGLSPT
jgi:hypothetical protein